MLLHKRFFRCHISSLIRLCYTYIIVIAICLYAFLCLAHVLCISNNFFRPYLLRRSFGLHFSFFPSCSRKLNTHDIFLHNYYFYFKFYSFGFMIHIINVQCSVYWHYIMDCRRLAVSYKHILEISQMVM